MHKSEINKNYFVYKGVKIVITEHFNRNGKSIEEIIKEAIIRDSNANTK